ncbi:hypothetical protein TELCIR_23663 [Teladorsagia circumcincta]|uniref:Immunoglobulin domain-containing protein n=1 Tax=Teladorsagia circumcincta TaxID=45464 RepID=A0A2G9TBN9_TELCI|nr:hypothetical protein TELCIR_23663 [Teladorsagia circumcincta]
MTLQFTLILTWWFLLIEITALNHSYYTSFMNEAGQYICTATDPRDKRPLDSDPVTLNIRQPEALPAGTLDRDGFLRITNAKMSDAGEYICTATDPRGGPPSEAPPARLNVNPRKFHRFN